MFDRYFSLTWEELGLGSSPSKLNISLENCSSGWMTFLAEGGGWPGSSWVRELSWKALQMGRWELVRRSDCRALELLMSCRSTSVPIYRTSSAEPIA